MKRIYSAVFCGALLAAAVRANAQPSGQMILSKSANGPVTSTSLELTLSANAQCDQTQSFLPDGSKLSSQSFSLDVDANGVGTFQGPAQIISPDGRTILQGQLRGTVGIGTRCGGDGACRRPWHLEGLFETARSNFERFIARSTTDVRVPVMMLNFSADQNPQSASPLPLYLGRLDGLIPSFSVTLKTDRDTYAEGETITVKITNDSNQSAVTMDHNSFCSVLDVQKQQANQWATIAPCLLMTPTRLVKLGPHEDFSVKLPTPEVTAKLDPGTYQLELTYWAMNESGQPVGNPTTVYSKTFTVASKE